MVELKTTTESQALTRDTPLHVAIIPDGNRRWARKDEKNSWDGHRIGAKNVKDIIKAARELKIRFLTFYAFSVENLKKRPFKEKRFLFKLFKEKFNELADAEEIHKEGVKVNFFGRIHLLPKIVIKAVNKVIERTKEYSNFFLNFCLAYDGRDELVDAVRSILKKGIPAESIDRETIKENLYTKGVPPPDLIIRTGMKEGECRLSGYLLWDSSYSEFYFTEKYWPDFDEKMFRTVIGNFSKRERRFGR
jgi:tritrans,polycis-undecaprenyl-diphosphate synthase [geranylgeranyl-diphosphate specific]